MLRSKWHVPMPDPLVWRQTVLPWMHEANQPFCDWAFGDADTARDLIGDWMARESSMHSLTRAIFLVEGDAPVACLIAADGRTVRHCRRADAEALALELGSGPEADRVFQEVASASARLFPPPNNDELYISAIAVSPSARGRGMGRGIVRAAFEAAKLEDLPALSLDVAASNAGAISMYQSLGFVEVTRSSCDQCGLSYVSMRAEV